MKEEKEEKHFISKKNDTRGIAIQDPDTGYELIKNAFNKGGIYCSFEQFSHLCKNKKEIE